MSNFLNIKEPVNAWAHLITFLAAVAGLVLIVVMTRTEVAFSIYHNQTKTTWP